MAVDEPKLLTSTADAELCAGMAVCNDVTTVWSLWLKSCIAQLGGNHSFNLQTWDKFHYHRVTVLDGPHTRKFWKSNLEPIARLCMCLPFACSQFCSPEFCSCIFFGGSHRSWSGFESILSIFAFVDASHHVSSGCFIVDVSHHAWSGVLSIQVI